MLTQTELERERYEARRKAQLDYNTLQKAAHLEGREVGLAEGLAEGRAEGKIGIIRFCERLLNRPETPEEELAALPMEDLTRLAEELQEQALKQQ